MLTNPQRAAWDDQGFLVCPGFSAVDLVAQLPEGAELVAEGIEGNSKAGPPLATRGLAPLASPNSSSRVSLITRISAPPLPQRRRHPAAGR